MTLSQYNRRNFLSSIAVLSVGSAFGSAAKHFSPANRVNDLQKNWKTFWKKSGGSIYYSLTDVKGSYNTKETKGHYYEYGETIYFPKENVLAQPTWIFWSDRTKPADVVVTLFENNHSSNKIITFNRYEMEALYRISKEPDSKLILLASFNQSQSIAGASTFIKTKTNIKKSSQIQDISYYKGQVLVFKNQTIHHT